MSPAYSSSGPAAVLAAMLVAAISPSCGSPPPGPEASRTGALSPGPHVLSGTVFGGGSAMPGAVVDALVDGTTTVVATSTSDTAGAYSLSLEDATYDLRIRPPSGSGFGEQAIQNVIMMGVDRRNDILLIAQGGVVAGRIRGREGVGLKGVAVQAYDAATWTHITGATTDGQGQYQLKLGAGSYHFVASTSEQPAGGPQTYWSVSLYSQTISGTTTLDVDLPVARVRGVVTDPQGAPVSNVAVKASGSGSSGSMSWFTSTAQAETGSGGEYELLLLTGSNTFTITPPGPYGTVVQSGVGIEGDTSRDFTLSEVTLVSGTVRGREGVGLKGVAVQAYDAATWAHITSATTDGQGQYQLDLGAGSYHFVASTSEQPAGGPQTYWSVSLYNETISGTTTLDLDLPVARVHGVVTDVNGAPVPNVAVKASGSGSSGSMSWFTSTAQAETGTGGEYELLLLTGSNTFTITPPGPYGTVVQSGVGIEGDTSRDFTLSEVTLVSGTVRGREGVGLKGVAVQAYDAATWTHITGGTTDGEGQYQLNLGAGSYHFVASTSEQPAGAPQTYWSLSLYSQTISEATTLDLDLPVARVRGVVTDTNGAPVPNVLVKASGSGSSGSMSWFTSTAQAETGAGGEYELLLLTGSATFTVSPPAASGFSTTVLSSVAVTGDFFQAVILQSPDLSPPIIVSGPSVVHLSDTSVSVRWQTNEPGDSLVEYGTGDLARSTVATNLVTTHEVTLSALAPSTVHQYRVSSRDAAGNGPAVSAIVTFKTQDPPGDVAPPVITNGPTVAGIGIDSAIVSWTTDEPASSVVSYGTTPGLGSGTSVPGQFTVEHQVALTGLAPNTTYFLRVGSTDPDGNGPTSSAIHSFTTTPEPDTAPPIIIEGPQVTNATSHSLTVVWVTDEPASSGVSYNDGSTFSVIADEKLVTRHEVVLAGLAALTTYNITVSSKDAAGNGPTLAGPVQGTTLAPSSNHPPVVLVPTRVDAEATSPSGATVTFTASATDDEDGTLTPTCVPSSGAGFPLGATTVTCTATDRAGAATAAIFDVIVGDTRGPIFTTAAERTEAFANCTAGARVTYVPPVAVDAVSGAVATVCAPAPGSRFAVGASTVTCTATDAAGNSAVTTFAVRVAYQAPTDGTFFLPPIKADGSGAYKIGSALPVKFRLTGVSAPLKNLQARLLVAPVESGGPGTYAPAVSKGGAHTENTFRYDRASKSYVFNLDTRRLTPGPWSIKADLGDGVLHEVRITISP